MNTTLINFESLIEWDNNPLIVFSQQGKILYLNNSAEILFGYVSKQELYNLTLSYAPKTFGYKTTAIKLNYNSYIFHSISIAYENEEQISLRLYHTPRISPIQKKDNTKLIKTDINLLLEANLALFQTKNTNTIKLLTDQDLPAFKIDQNSFSKLLRKVLHSFRASDSIDIYLKLLIGQYIMIEHQKIYLVELGVCANGRYCDEDEELRILSIDNQIKLILSEHYIKLEIPLLN